MIDPFQPITPKAAEAQRGKEFPTFAIVAINDTIVNTLDKGSASVQWSMLRDKIFEARLNRDMNPGGFLAYEHISRDKLFEMITPDDIHRIYGDAGWKVEFDFPGYNEFYQTTVTFRKSK